jgi:hypothetical protein
LSHNPTPFHSTFLFIPPHTINTPSTTNYPLPLQKKGSHGLEIVNVSMADRAASTLCSPLNPPHSDSDSGATMVEANLHIADSIATAVANAVVNAVTSVFGATGIATTATTTTTTTTAATTHVAPTTIITANNSNNINIDDSESDSDSDAEHADTAPLANSTTPRPLNRNSDFFFEGVKVLGDRNVPAGQLTFCVDIRNPSDMSETSESRASYLHVA